MVLERGRGESCLARWWWRRKGGGGGGEAHSLSGVVRPVV